MVSSWEIFQERIKNEMRKKFSKTVIEHSSDPRNIGNIDDANGYARVTGPSDETMEIWLKVDGDTIVKAGFSSTGCGITIASGSVITEMVKGKNTNDALAIGQQDVLDALGGLPDDNKHCALLASNTLKAAIIDYIQKKNHH